MKNFFQPARLCGFIFFVFCIFTTSNLLQAQWVTTQGPFNGWINSLAVSGTNLFAGTSEHGVFLSTDNFTSWTAVNTGLTNPTVVSFAISGTNLFAGTLDGVFLSTDNGTGWTAVSNGLPANTNVRALAVCGTNLFVGTDDGVYLSTNNGSLWTAADAGIPDQNDIYSLAVIGTNIFAGCNGAGTVAGGVYLSTNNGTSWIVVRDGLLSPAVYDLAVSGTNLFAGTVGGGVYLSTNYGTSWTGVNSGIPTTAWYSFMAVSGTNIFRSVYYNGVYLSTDNGTNWTPVNSGLANGAYILKLAVNETYLFGNEAGLVYKRPLSEMITDIEDTKQLPTEFLLSQNYPNPFNPSTKIKYSVPQSSQLSLKIFNTLGKEIATLANEEKSVGSYEVNWNAADIPSGVYFYQLKAGNYVENKKMILLK